MQAAGSGDGARARDQVIVHVLSACLEYVRCQLFVMLLGGLGVMQAFRLLETMRRVGLSPDQGTCDTLIATCAKAAAAGDPDGAEYGLRVLGMMAEEGITPDAAMRNALMGECLRTAEENSAVAVDDAGGEGGGGGEEGDSGQGWHGVEWVARALGAMAHHLAASAERPSDEAAAAAWEAGEAVGRRLYQRLAEVCVRHVAALARGAELPESEGAAGHSGEERAPAEVGGEGTGMAPSGPTALEVGDDGAAEGGGAGTGGDGEALAATDGDAEWWDAPAPDAATANTQAADDGAAARALSPVGAPRASAMARREQARSAVVRWPACDGCGVGVGGLRRREPEGGGVGVAAGDSGIDSGLSGHISQELFARLQRLASQQLKDLRHHRQQLQARDAAAAAAAAGLTARRRLATRGGLRAASDARGRVAGSASMDRIPADERADSPPREAGGSVEAAEAVDLEEPQTPLSHIRSKVVAFSQTVLSEIEQLKGQQASVGALPGEAADGECADTAPYGQEEAEGAEGAVGQFPGEDLELEAGQGSAETAAEEEPLIAYRAGEVADDGVGDGDGGVAALRQSAGAAAEGQRAGWAVDAGAAHLAWSAPAAATAAGGLLAAPCAAVPAVIPAVLSLPLQVVPAAVTAVAAPHLLEGAALPLARTVAVIAPAPAALVGAAAAAAFPPPPTSPAQLWSVAAPAQELAAVASGMHHHAPLSAPPQPPPPGSPPPGGPSDMAVRSAQARGAARSPGPRLRASPEASSEGHSAAWPPATGEGGTPDGGGGRAEPHGSYRRARAKGEAVGAAHAGGAGDGPRSWEGRDPAGAALRSLDVEQVGAAGPAAPCESRGARGCGRGCGIARRRAPSGRVRAAVARFAGRARSPSPDRG